MQAMDASPAAPPPERLGKWQTAVEQMSKDSAEAATGQAHTPPRQAGFGMLRSWFRQKTGMHFATLATAAVVVAILAISLLAPRRRDRQLENPAAYLVLGRGTAEVGGPPKRIASGSVKTLWSHEDIRLPAGASATVITPKGAVSLQGPQTV